MNRCPITYERCEPAKYSKKGLHLLAKELTSLNDFPYTSKEQIQMAVHLAAKLSIQGVQPKLSVILNREKEVFEIVEKKGKFIIKPPHHIYEELAVNEDLTMKLASIVGIEVPLHGLVYNSDGTLSYFIKRFDRSVKNQKIGVEDFSQLMNLSRDSKYDSNMEKVILVIEKYCTFPALEKVKLFRLTVFNFLVGNEDMHLKNFSLITRGNKVELSPAYDLVNSTIALKTKEEIALPIRGKKSNLTRADIVDYFGNQRLSISSETLAGEILIFEKSLPKWKKTIEASFLSQKGQEQYFHLIQGRMKRLMQEV